MPKSVRGVMREFKDGALHSGSSTGPTVKKRTQAIAIALSEQRQMGKKRDVESGGAMKVSFPRHKNLGKYLHPKGGY